VQDKGGVYPFCKFLAEQLQYGAFWDQEKAEGDLGDFQSASHGWTDKTARGDSWLNIFKDGMAQKLLGLLDDTLLHGIAAKLVHDYYNRNGMLVHNRKGMTFLTKGDGRADEAPEAQRIMSLAVLESRNQITQMGRTGQTPDLMQVWDYTPDFDKTMFTETSGKQVLQLIFSDGDRLWRMLKEYFTAIPKPAPARTPGGVDKGIAATADPGEDPKAAPDGRVTADMGTPPVRSWLRKRREYIRKHGQPLPFANTVLKAE